MRARTPAGYRRVEELRDAGETVQAFQELQSLLMAHPANDGLAAEVLDLLILADDTAARDAWVARAVADGCTARNVRLQHADQLLEQHPEQAIPLYVQASERWCDPKTYAKLARAYRLLKRYPEAEACLCQAWFCAGRDADLQAELKQRFEECQATYRVLAGEAPLSAPAPQPSGEPRKVPDAAPEASPNR